MIEIPPEYLITWRFEDGKWKRGQFYEIEENGEQEVRRS